jgi:hypothetical protein
MLRPGSLRSRLWKPGIRLWKKHNALWVRRSPWQPVEKVRHQSSRRGSHELDRSPPHHVPLARARVHSGSVGRDCPCGAQIARVKTSRSAWALIVAHEPARLEGNGPGDLPRRPLATSAYSARLAGHTSRPSRSGAPKGAASPIADFPTSNGANEQHERSPGDPYQRGGPSSRQKAIGPSPQHNVAFRAN